MTNGSEINDLNTSIAKDNGIITNHHLINSCKINNLTNVSTCIASRSRNPQWAMA